MAAVENTWLCRVGMVVFRSMILVAIPPTVSMARDSGVTSIRIISAALPVVISPPSFPP